MSTHSSFPDLHSRIPTAVLLDVYEAAPSRITQVISDLTDQDLWERARGPERWSIAEIVCHLADSELIGAARLRLLRTNPGGQLVTYEQDDFANLLGYRDRSRSDVDDALDVFTSLRRANRELMRTWEPEAWELSGQHYHWNEVTLRQLLELYTDHGENHLDQILDTRVRLGNPTTLGSILSGRLGVRTPAATTSGTGRGTS